MVEDVQGPKHGQASGLHKTPDYGRRHSQKKWSRKSSTKKKTRTDSLGKLIPMTPPREAYKCKMTILCKNFLQMHLYCGRSGVVLAKVVNFTFFSGEIADLAKQIAQMFIKIYHSRSTM